MHVSVEARPAVLARAMLRGPPRHREHASAPIAGEEALPSSAAGFATVSLVKHALFIHRQLPQVYDELRYATEMSVMQRAEAKEAGGPARRPPRPGGAEAKAIKLFSVAEPLLGHIGPAFDAAADADDAAAEDADEESDPALLAAVVLGSSVASPKVVYLVRVAYGCDEEVPVPRDFERRVLRAVAVQCAPLASVNPGLCRLHVLIRARREAQLPEAHFQPRPGLKLKLKRAHVATLSTGAPAAALADVPPPHEWCPSLVTDMVLPPRATPRHLASRAAGAEPADDDAAVSDAPEDDGDEHSPRPGEAAADEDDLALPGVGAAEPAGTEWIWWQSKALLKGFRLASGGAAPF